ncbi:MAG: hypothetical protein AAFN81_32650, partial [Bacteroidota bacterium]
MKTTHSFLSLLFCLLFEPLLGQQPTLERRIPVNPEAPIRITQVDNRNNIDVSGNFMMAGFPYAQNASGANTGAVYAYERNPDGSWVQKQQITQDGGSYFGYYLSVSGDLAFIAGAKDKGELYIYKRNANSGLWEDQKVTINAAFLKNISTRFNLEGNLLTISTGMHNVGTQVFRFNEADKTCTKVQELNPGFDVASDPENGRIVLGGNSSTNQNVFSLYELNAAGNQWGNLFRANSDKTLSFLGSEVAIGGDYFVLSPMRPQTIEGETDPVSGVVFQRQTNGGWAQRQYLSFGTEPVIRVIDMEMSENVLAIVGGTNVGSKTSWDNHYRLFAYKRTATGWDKLGNVSLPAGMNMFGRLA